MVDNEARRLLRKIIHALFTLQVQLKTSIFNDLLLKVKKVITFQI